MTNHLDDIAQGREKATVEGKLLKTADVDALSAER